MMGTEGPNKEVGPAEKPRRSTTVTLAATPKADVGHSLAGDAMNLEEQKMNKPADTKPIAGIVSIMSSPVCWIGVSIVRSVLLKADFLGFATALVVFFIFICTIVSGLIAGIIALRTTMNSALNGPLGFMGLLLTMLNLVFLFSMKSWLH